MKNKMNTSLVKKIVQSMCIPPIAPGENVFIATNKGQAAAQLRAMIERVEKRRLEKCLAAIAQGADAPKSLPKEFQNPDIDLAAGQLDWRTYVQEIFKNAELCLVAVQQQGYALRYVPDQLKTAELCLAAVQQYGCALEYVPEKLKTPELCHVAVQQSGAALLFVPKKLVHPVKEYFAS